MRWGRHARRAARRTRLPDSSRPKEGGRGADHTIQVESSMLPSAAIPSGANSQIGEGAVAGLRQQEGEQHESGHAHNLLTANARSASSV